MGVYSSVQFFGAFFGAAVGGALMQFVGGNAVFVFGIVLLLLAGGSIRACSLRRRCAPGCIICRK